MASWPSRFSEAWMRGLALLAIVGAVVLGPVAAQADERVSGECLISVGGRTYLDGPCRITLYPGGGFQAGGRGRGAYFATVDIDSASGGATSFWNGVDAESHAHDPLGTVVRQGGCWVNSNERVCAWRPGTRPRAEAQRRPPGALPARRARQPSYAALPPSRSGPTWARLWQAPPGCCRRRRATWSS